MPNPHAIVFRRASEIESLETIRSDLDAIFYESSLTKTFPSDAVRAAFRERWLGRYLDFAPELFHLAFADRAVGDERVVGYLAGALDDPAQTERYRDIGYFPRLSEWTARFPAHLHINVASSARSLGIGQALIERFVGDVAAAGLPGVHVVTGAMSRNVGFYRRNGFTSAHEFDWQGVPLVFLGRLT
ncbi:MAG: GNAT family N-acetyltransferase [Hyphomicrobiaceae bacterium]|nr:GNAT family N-acetyltransferase [Hyphomicrobiaceae bacterium]